MPGYAALIAFVASCIASVALAPAQAATLPDLAPIVRGSGGVISGRVRYQDGTPIAGLDVSLSVSNVTLLAITRADGTYELDDAPAGEYRVCAGGIESASVQQCFDHIDQVVGTGFHYTPVTLDAGGALTNIDFDLDRGGSISGRLIDAFSGQPIADTTFGISFSNPDLAYLGQASATTDLRGDYRVDGIPAGAWYALIHLGGPFGDAQQIWPDVMCNESTCDIQAGDLIDVADSEVTPDIDFDFHPDVLIRGRVTDATTSAGLPGITVNSYWIFELPFGWEVFTTTTTRSDADGNYVLYAYGNSPSDNDTVYYVGSLGSAPYIDISYPDAPFADIHGVVNGTSLLLHHGDQLDGIDLALPPGGAVSGTVYDVHSGTPVAQAAVTYFREDATILWIGFTGDDGRFTTPGWFPGTYYLEASSFLGPNACLVYLDRPCPNAEPLFSVNPTPLVLSAGELRTGIDFPLDIDAVFASSFEFDE